MHNNVKVSIITPSFNQGQYLEETILSVLNQTYKNIEYIIIDGSSTDNSIDIIKKYESQLFFWISEKDNGQADAINKGFQKATGDLVCWVNSDDILYPHFVSERVKQFQQHPACSFIYGDVEQGHDFNTRTIRAGDTTNFISMLTTLIIPIPQQSAMWRKTLFEQVGYLDPQWNVLLDREFFMRIALHSTILYMPGVVGFFRNHKNSKSIALWVKWAEELDVYYDQLFKDKQIYAVFGKYERQAKASMYYTCSKINRDCHDYSQAKMYLRKAYSLNFSGTLNKEVYSFLKNIKKKLK